MSPFAGLARSALAALLLGACAESVAPKGPVDHVLAVSGGGQAGVTLDTLSEQLVARLVDDAGMPLAGRPVTWSASAEAAAILPVSPVTDAGGTVRAIAILGFTPGEQRFVARADGFDDEAVFVIEAASRPGFKAVSLMQGGAASHMCAIDAEARAWCWGPNEAGELGSGDFDPSPVPKLVQRTLRFRQLWGMFRGTCGITTTAELWCWGNGELLNAFFGYDGPSGISAPVPVVPGMRFQTFDADTRVACGIAADRSAWCGGFGVLGDGSPSRASGGLVLVAGGTHWQEIGVEDSRICGIDTGFSAWCWGSAASQAGLGSGVALVPARVPDLPRLTGLAVGWGLGTAAQCALSAGGGGVLICWGTWNGEVTMARPGNLPVTSLRIETQTGMAKTTDGRLWIWGEPPEGYDGGISDVPVPLEPVGPWLDFTSAEGAYAISAADSVVYRWTGFPGFGPPVGLMPRPVPAP